MNQIKFLMIAFHFPPFAGSSGVQRTLRFCQYLPKFGWLPVILSANPRAYGSRADDLIQQIPGQIETTRAFALDSARHLSIKGRYIRIFAVPDRWVSWVAGAVPSGLRLIKRHRPKLIWSTYPIATAHLIAWLLHRISRLPWVADFRDPMVEQDPRTGDWTPSNRLVRNARLFIEKRAATYATKLVFCTDGARRICERRYPDANHRNWHVVTNGFDEETFVRAEKLLSNKKRTKSTRLTLLHSGILYDSPDRDPRCFFEALSQLKREGKIDAKSLQVKLRACGHDATYSAIVAKNDIGDIVRFEAAIPYSDAIEEMLTVDGLVVFQGYTSNPAIPAKLYEYMRARRPIFALADSEGDTAKFLKQLGMIDIAPLLEVDVIKSKLSNFLEKLTAGTFHTVPDDVVMEHSRERTAQKLAELLNSI